MDFIDKNVLCLWRAVPGFEEKQQSFSDLILLKHKSVRAGRFFSSKEVDAPAVWDLTIGRVCAFAEAAL